MRDLANPQLIKAKGIMFFVVGLIAAMLLILEQPSLRIALLLSICVWCFCRAYYFAFYVIEHYVDPGYRFSGLISFCRYLFQRKGAGAESSQQPR